MRPSTFEELIENNSFHKWITTGRTMDNEIWQTYLQQNPDKASLIDEAEQFILNFQFQPQTLATPELDAAWAKLEQRIEPSAKVIAMTRGYSRRMILQIAATLALLITAATSIWWFYSKDAMLARQTDFGEQLNLRFWDDTQVALNANSKLTFDKNFYKKSVRKVYLEGQAFFDVQQLASKATFEVVTDNFIVEVLGTEFDITARPNNQSIVLKSGKIKVHFDEAQTIHENGTTITTNEILLAPNECLRRAANHYYKTTINTANHIAWLNKKLILDETTFEELATIIKDLYGYDIKFEDGQLSNKAISGTLPLKNFDVLLLSIQEVFGVSVQKVSEKSLLFVQQ